MNKTEQTLRKILREELSKTISKEFSLLEKRLLTTVNKLLEQKMKTKKVESVDDTIKTIQHGLSLHKQVQKKASPSKIKYTSNSLLNDLLNETITEDYEHEYNVTGLEFDDELNIQQPQIEYSEENKNQMPPTNMKKGGINDIMNKDYSKLLKVANESAKQFRGIS